MKLEVEEVNGDTKRFRVLSGALEIVTAQKEDHRTFG